MFPSIVNGILSRKRCSVEDNSEEKIESGLKVFLKVCTGCRTTDTPLWRSGPEGPKSLCNACGIRYSKRRRMNFKKVKERKPDAGCCRGGGIPDDFVVALETEEMKKRQREKQEKLLGVLLRLRREANWSCRKRVPASPGGGADCEEVAEAARLLLTMSSEMPNHS